MGVVVGYGIVATLVFNRPRMNIYSYATLTARAEQNVNGNAQPMGADGRSYLTPDAHRSARDTSTGTAVVSLDALSPSPAAGRYATSTAEPLTYLTPAATPEPTITEYAPTEYVRVIPTRFYVTRVPNNSSGSGEIIYITQPPRIIFMTIPAPPPQIVVVTSAPRIITATLTPSVTFTPSPEITIEVTYEISPEFTFTPVVDATWTNTPAPNAVTITPVPLATATPDETVSPFTATITPAVTVTIDYVQPVSTDVLQPAVVDAS